VGLFGFVYLMGVIPLCRGIFIVCAHRARPTHGKGSRSERLASIRGSRGSWKKGLRFYSFVLLYRLTCLYIIHRYVLWCAVCSI